MAQEKPKDIKCQYSSLCTLLNNDVLPINVQKEMCGLNHPEDKAYEPQVPEPVEFNPKEDYAHGPGGTCDSFMRYKDSKLIDTIARQLGSMVELLEEKGYM